MKLKSKLAVAITAIGLVIGYSCKKTKVVDPAICTGAVPTYTANVKAILDAKCATSGCHNATDKADGFDIVGYTNAKKVASTDADFLPSIKHEGTITPMPFNRAKLSDVDIKTIECWVKNGFLEQ